MKNLQPTGFELHRDKLEIRWSDGQATWHSMEVLRRICPCATCRVEREKLQGPRNLASLRVISSSTPDRIQAQIVEVVPVGRYALTFRWNDGHQTGIYAYDLLLEHQL